MRNPPQSSSNPPTPNCRDASVGPRMGGNHKVSLRRRVQSRESLGSGRAALLSYSHPDRCEDGNLFRPRREVGEPQNIAGRRLMAYQSSCRIAAPKDRSMANWFESRAETMTETEAKAYFTESSYPHPGPGEAWGEAIKRAYLD